MENTNKIRLESGSINSYLNKLIKYGQWIIILLGIILFFIVYMFKEYEIICNIGYQIAGVFVSTGLVSIFFEKHKDAIKENNEQLDRISILKKQHNRDIYYSIKDQELMFVINRPNLDIDENYSFASLTDKVSSQRDKHPVFIFGTTLGFLKDEITEMKNRQALHNAILNGVNFKFTIVNPQSLDSDKYEEKISTINAVITSISTLIYDLEKDDKIDLSNIGSIDVRAISEIENNSFSSFICNGRKICVLDFNFDGGKKISQVFDEKYFGEESFDNCLSMELSSRFNKQHRKGIPIIVFPKINIKIHIIALANFGLTANESNIVNEKRMLFILRQNNKDKSDYILPNMNILKGDHKNISENLLDSFKIQTGGNEIQLIELLSPSNEFNENHTEIFLIAKITISKPQENIVYLAYNKAISQKVFEKISPEERDKLKLFCRN